MPALREQLMGTSGRLTLAITCLLVGVLLHVTLCQWSLSWPVGTPLITIEVNNDRMGLFTTQDIGHADGVVFGIALPLILLGVAVSQVLEVVSQRGQLRGGCPGCGYDLRLHSGGACPECGMKCRGSKST